MNNPNSSYISNFPHVAFPHSFTHQQTLLNRACRRLSNQGHESFLATCSSSSQGCYHVTIPQYTWLFFFFFSSGGVLGSQHSFLMPFILLHSFCSNPSFMYSHNVDSRCVHRPLNSSRSVSKKN